MKWRKMVKKPDIKRSNYVCLWYPFFKRHVWVSLTLQKISFLLQCNFRLAFFVSSPSNFFLQFHVLKTSLFRFVDSCRHWICTFLQLCKNDDYSRRLKTFFLPASTWSCVCLSTKGIQLRRGFTLVFWQRVVCFLIWKMVLQKCTRQK